MSNIENKENDAACQDDHSNKLNGETSTPRPTFRRSVLRAFDPFYQSPGVNNIKTLVADEEELYEDAQSSLNPCKEALLMPELNTGKPLPNLNDTEDLSFAECMESPSQITRSRNNVSSSEDEVEFNYKIKSPTKALSKSTAQNESVVLIQLEPVSEEKQLNRTFEGAEDAVDDHQIVFVDIQLNTTMDGTTLTGQQTGDGDLDPLHVDNDQESARSLTGDDSDLKFPQDILHSENGEDLIKVENLHGTNLQQDVENSNAAQDDKDLISHSKLNTTLTHQDVDNVEPSNIQQDISELETAQEMSQAVKEEDTKAARDNEELVSKSEVYTAPTHQDVERIGPVENKEVQLIQPRNDSITVEQQKTNARSDLDPLKVEQRICLSENDVANLDRTHPRDDVELTKSKSELFAVEQDGTPENQSFTVKEEDTKAARDNEELISELEVDTAPTRQDVETISTDLTVEPVENKEPQAEILNRTYSQEEVQLIQPPNELITVEQQKTNAHSDLNPLKVEQRICLSENDVANLDRTHLRDDVKLTKPKSELFAVEQDGTPENQSFTVKEEDTKAARDSEELISEAEVNTAPTHQDVETISIDLTVEPVENKEPQAEILNRTYSQEEVQLIQPPNELITVEQQKTNAHSDLNPLKVEQRICLSENDVANLDRTHLRDDVKLTKPKSELFAVEQDGTPENQSFTVKEEDTKAARDSEELISEAEVNTAPTHQDVETISIDLTVEPVENKEPQTEILNGTYSQEEVQLIQPPNEPITVEQQKTNAHNDLDSSEIEQRICLSENDVANLDRTHPQDDVDLIGPKSEPFAVEQENTNATQDDKDAIIHNTQSKLDGTYSQDDVESAQPNNESFTIEQHNTEAGQDNKESVSDSKVDTAPTHQNLNPPESEEVVSQFNSENDSPKVEKLNGTYSQDDVEANNESFTVDRPNLDSKVTHRNVDKLGSNLDPSDIEHNISQDDVESNQFSSESFTVEQHNTHAVDSNNGSFIVEVQNSNAVEDDKESNLDDANADIPACGSISSDSSLTTGKSNDLNSTYETSMNENKPIASLNIADPENAIEELARSLNQTIDVEESAIVDDLNVTDPSNDTLNNTLELVKENAQDVSKNLEGVTAVETPDITMEKLLNEKKTERDLLKNKLDELRSELAKWKEENVRCDQQILTEALARQAELDKIRRYKKVAEQYEQEVTRQNETFCSYRLETERDHVRLASTEMAFSVLFEKYEKTKTVIAACVKNETILKESIERTERLAESAAAKYATMQERHKQNIQRIKEQAMLEQEAYRQEIAKLKTVAKRFEIKIGSLENAIKQKCEEAVALSQLCDEMTGRPPT